MLADLVLSSIKTQRKADSWKKVKGYAQLDLLLCSDPSCTLLADLVKVEQEGGVPAAGPLQPRALRHPLSKQVWGQLLAWGEIAW
jgi:hypothetical protein